ncbi:unnamed protein product [Moneuplotes crassus]|uniref:Uncharacterized protein n=1 Tax=Euplotes crassus TaxID=5936 RepID=A0AAD1Y5W5_EUPCR|nr:unnamed protein product [Moneuplotes crassus]
MNSFKISEDMNFQKNLQKQANLLTEIEKRLKNVEVQHAELVYSADMQYLVSLNTGPSASALTPTSEATLMINKDIVTPPMVKMGMETISKEFESKIDDQIQKLNLSLEEKFVKCKSITSMEFNYDAQISSVLKQINELKFRTRDQIDEVKRNFHTELLTKASVLSIKEVVDKSVDKSELVDIHDKIKLINDKILQLEDHLKSEPDSEEKDSDTSEEEYNEEFEQDQVEIEESKQGEAATPLVEEKFLPKLDTNPSPNVVKNTSLKVSPASHSKKDVKTSAKKPKVRMLNADLENTKLRRSIEEQMELPNYESEKKLETIPQSDIDHENFNQLASAKRSPKEESPQIIQRPGFQSKGSMKFRNTNNENLVQNFNKSCEQTAQKKHKKPEYFEKENPKFAISESSVYNGETANSKEISVIKQSKESFNFGMPKMKINRRMVSKLSIETPFTTHESSTATLINKLMMKSQKSKGKKIRRSEIESIFNLIQDVLVNTSNNRMRIDTLEGNIDLKIENSIKKLRKETMSAMADIERQTKEDHQKLNLRLDEFQRLNFRLNKTILEKPYKYADEMKESMIKSQKEQEKAFNRKYDMLLSRITAMKRWQQEMANSGYQNSSPVFNEEVLKEEIKKEFENSKLAILQEDHEILKSDLETQFSSVTTKLANIENIIDEFKENIELQVYEFKSHTKYEVNNKLKELEALNRELQRHQDLYRQILGSHYLDTQKAEHMSVVIPRVEMTKSSSKGSFHQKFRSNSLSSGKKGKIRESKRYNSNIEEKSPDGEEIGTTFRVELKKLNKSVLPNIQKSRKSIPLLSKSSSRLNLSGISPKLDKEIEDTLKKIKDPDSKRYKVLKKFLKNEIEPVHSRGQSVTPMKMYLNSKVHVNLSNLA